MAPEAGRPDAPYLDSADGFAGRKGASRPLVEEPTCDDRDPPALCRQAEGNVAEHLAGGGMIRVEKAIDENDLRQNDLAIGLPSMGLP